jgi:SAM-dependent methyltransferase
VSHDVLSSTVVEPTIASDLQQFVRTTCFSCGTQRHRQLFFKFGYSIVKCEACGIVFCDYLPSQEELTEYYSEGYFRGCTDRRGYYDYEADERLLKASFLRKLQLVNKLTPQIGTLLDIGCAAGYFVELALSQGWNAYGLEISRFAASKARRRGLRVVNGVSPAVFQSGRFDVVTMWDVVEHLLDPTKSLQEVNRVLKPGGLLGLCTGRIDSLLAKLLGRRSRIFNPPQHLVFFSRESIQRVLGLAGFRVIKVLADKKVVSLRYLLHLQMSLYGADWIDDIARRLMKSSFNPAIPLWVPDNMVVLAKKL